MSDYLHMSKDELKAEYSSAKQEYEKLRALHLSLDMSRGKPGADNMDLSEKMFDLVGNDTGFKNIDGIDCRNYGGLDGLRELKNLFAEVLGLAPDQIIVGGNSSLNMMFDTIAQAMTHGLGGEPWGKQSGLKFLCPAPGYDRHFAITEYFGFELIPVKLNADGPDMDAVEELICDEKVKGIWCVPKFSNPGGITYSMRLFAVLQNLNLPQKILKSFGITHIAFMTFMTKATSCLTFMTSVSRWATPTCRLFLRQLQKFHSPVPVWRLPQEAPTMYQYLKAV